MNGTPAFGPQPSQFSPRQVELMAELAKASAKHRLADMFAGAVYALQNTANPEAIPQAAHSLRELMEKLEGEKNIPITDKAIAAAAGNLKDKTSDLRPHWEKAKAGACFQNGTWSGQIDTPLATFLVHAEEHFVWFGNNPKYLKHKAAAIVTRLDPRAAVLSQSEQEAQVEEWKDLRYYFQGIAHHGPGPTLAAFQAKMAQLEAFLHARLAPVVAENQSKLQQLIEEVEPDGH